MNALTLYNEIWRSTSELEAWCKESLTPRGADILYDLFASFGPTARSEVIDIGCRDASYAIELAQRFECQVFGIDLAPIHIERAHEKIAKAGLTGRVRAELAAIEAIPLADGSLDMIWCRDVRNHVDLSRGLAECVRVLKPRGQMLVYQTFATPALEEREAARIYAALAIVPQNMDEDFFQATAQEAGLSITTRDLVSSERRERWAEEGSTALLDDLLGVVRRDEARRDSSHSMDASAMRRPTPTACGVSTRRLANSSRRSICACDELHLAGIIQDRDIPWRRRIDTGLDTETEPPLEDDRALIFWQRPANQPPQPQVIDISSSKLLRKPPAPSRSLGCDYN